MTWKLWSLPVPLFSEDLYMTFFFNGDCIRTVTPLNPTLAMLSKFLLIVCCLWAKIQATVTLVSPSTNQTGPFNSSSLAVDNDAAGIDPRFTVEFESLTDDLSDKSTYMSALFYMFALSEVRFEATSCGRGYVAPGYEDIEILMLPSIPGEITLQVRFMMWGLFFTVRRMANENFVATTTHLFWNQDGQRIPVGFVIIQKRSETQHVGLAKRATEPICASGGASGDNRTTPSEKSSAELSSANSSSLDLQSQSTQNISDKVVPSAGPNITDTALDAGKARFRVDFDGPRLSKYGIFIVALQAMVSLAALPRDQPAVMGMTVGDFQSQTQLELHTSKDSQKGSPGLVYEKAIWLLWKVPIYMYSVNRFGQCTFTLSEGNTEVGTGTFKKNSFRVEPAVDAA